MNIPPILIKIYLSTKIFLLHTFAKSVTFAIKDYHHEEQEHHHLFPDGHHTSDDHLLPLHQADEQHPEDHLQQSDTDDGQRSAKHPEQTEDNHPDNLSSDANTRAP
ncbi:MAG: hypothetical protein J6V75_06025 [Bacteroidaceae bacterium]|nr:hypothetical protein [Bacteroidaceae bacterium]